MQIKSIVLFFVAAACTLGVSAQKKSKKQKKLVPATLIQPAETAGVDGRTFSYALGVAQGRSLKQFLIRQMRVDSAYIDYAIDGMQSKMNEKERKQAQAFAAGLQIGEMNAKNLPAMNKQACGNADSIYIDRAEYERGMAEIVLGKESTLTPDSAEALVTRQFQHQQEVYKNLNIQWLANNKKQKGVKTTPSGLQYRVLTEGKGAIAADSVEVEVNYEGKLIDGSVFDSSYERGQSATFSPKQVIKGWTEALTMMPEGSKWELYIPSELGYGERGNGQKIPGHSTLIFQVEVLKVKTAAPEK